MPKENKTQKTTKSPTAFLNEIKDTSQRKQAKELLSVFKEATGAKPKMWGPSIIGFGEYTYKRRDGSEHTFLTVGFSPRKGQISVYALPSVKEQKDLLDKLGKHKTGVSCIYIKNLDDIDTKVLQKIIKQSFKKLNGTYQEY